MHTLFSSPSKLPRHHVCFAFHDSLPWWSVPDDRFGLGRLQSCLGYDRPGLNRHMLIFVAGQWQICEYCRDHSIAVFASQCARRLPRHSLVT